MFIGIDLGTSSVKLLLLGKNGEILKTTTKDYPIHYLNQNWAEQNPEDWFQAVLRGLHDLLKEVNKSSIKGIGFSGQMHGMVILDKDDIVIRNAILWNDQRTEKECQYLNEVIGVEKLSYYTANRALTGFTAPKVLWLKENEPENFRKIDKILLPKDYIAYRLSKVFATDVSDASGTLYFDVKNRDWSKEMLEILFLKPSQLPRIYESCEVIGKIDKEIALELGLSKDTKIVIGGSDQAVGAIGTGTVSNEACSISLGTSGVVYVATDVFMVDQDNALHSFCSASGHYHLMGVILNAASSLKWWTEQILEADYERILKDINEDTINEQVYFLPYLLGERTPINDPYAKGCFIGLSLNHNKSHMSRAILEGVCFALRDSFEILKSLGIKIKQVRVTGGGAKSKEWIQMLSDILNVTVETIHTNEGPALGAAILAAVGCDAYPSVTDACEVIIQVKDRYQPIKSHVSIYQIKYQNYKLLYPQLKTIFKKIHGSVNDES